MFKTLLIAAAALLLLSGCNKLTKANYDKVTTGMQYDEVVRHLGDPDNCSEALGLMSCEWKNGDAEVSVSFIGNKVTLVTGSGLK